MVEDASSDNAIALGKNPDCQQTTPVCSRYHHGHHGNPQSGSRNYDLLLNYYTVFHPVARPSHTFT